MEGEHNKLLDRSLGWRTKVKKLHNKIGSTKQHIIRAGRHCDLDGNWTTTEPYPESPIIKILRVFFRGAVVCIGIAIGDAIMDQCCCYCCCWCCFVGCCWWWWFLGILIVLVVVLLLVVFDFILDESKNTTQP